MIAKSDRHRTRVGKRNQITIPAAMLRQLGVAPGQQVEMWVDEEARIRVEKAEDAIDKALGLLYTEGLPHLTDAQLREAIREASQNVATQRYLRSLADA